MLSKISFGCFKGKKLPYSINSPSKGMRPTTSMTRSVLFNVLMHNSKCNYFDFSDASIADLYCGSGMVGIEFISLGAKNLFFVDSDFNCISALKKNIASLNADLDIKIKLKKLPFAFLQDKFDIVFLDPPYDSDYIAEKQIEIMTLNDNLSSKCIVVIEKDNRVATQQIDGLNVLLEKRVNGKTKLVFYQKSE